MTDDVPPAGAPLAAFVEGILDGRVADAQALAKATEELGRAGAGPFRCDIQGGRFSLLPIDTQVPPGFDDAAQARFLAALEHVLAGAVPGTVEGNLRCRLVFAGDVAETLFVVRGPRIEPLTRRRPRTAADVAAAAPASAPLPFGLRMREVVWMAPLLLLLASFFAWRSGWVDRVLAARAEALHVDNGPFGALLAVGVDRSWGDYEVSLRRGADYPSTPQALAERLAKQTEHAQHTASSIVGDGRDLYVQIVDAEQHVLTEVRAEMRPLLTAADAVVVARLPGQMNASTVRLSIVAGLRAK